MVNMDPKITDTKITDTKNEKNKDKSVSATNNSPSSASKENMSSETYPDLSSSSIPFWTENPNVLLNKEYIFEFYPHETMTYNQKLNALSRTIILVSLLSFLITRNIRVLVVSFITLGAIFILHKYKDMETKKMKESYANPAIDVINHTTNAPDLSTQNVFQGSSATNPFSNVLISDYDSNPNKKPALPTADYKDEILKNAKLLIQEQNPDQPDIADKLFTNLTDQFDFEQSMRPFYSTASTTIPNDQAGFAEYCYGSMISCKEGNLFACARNKSNFILY